MKFAPWSIGAGAPSAARLHQKAVAVVAIALHEARVGEAVVDTDLGWFGGGMPGVNQLANILHFVFSLTDHFYPQPGLLTLLLVAGLGTGVFLLSRNHR